MGKAVANKRSPAGLAEQTGPARRSWKAFLIDAVQHKRWAMVVLAAISGVMLSVIFAPHNLWPLAYVCLVPWLVGVICSQRRTWMFFVSYLMGVAFFFYNLNWLWVVTTWPPNGIFGVPVPIGTLLLALYLGLYLPLAAWLIRFAYRRMRTPLALVVPIVWTATEFVRAYLPAVPYDGQWQYTGLQWFFLAHSHYNVLPVIQMADLAGAYGVSFLIAMVNGWLAELIVHPLVFSVAGRWTRRAKVITTVVLVLLFANLGYGVFRLQEKLEPGPKIAVVQTDEPLFVDSGGYRISPYALQRIEWNLIHEALAQKPDIVVLPETMWPWRLNREFREMKPDAQTRYSGYEREQNRARITHERLKQLAAESGATLVIGTLAQERHPERVAYLQNGRFNSALVYKPGEDEPERYDKRHLVLFGEFIPFRGGRLHRLYNKLNSVMPWPDEYSLTAGTKATVFTAAAPSLGGKTFRFGTPICYEITMSNACRQFVAGPEGKRADLLINLSNDGWFEYTSELPQHLAVAVFRAVENRVGLARSVNTGISALVDPNGRILDAMLKDGKWRFPAHQRRLGRRLEPPLPYKGLSGVLVAQVPVDSQVTLYMRWGNWLPISCLIAAGLMLLAWWVDRTYIAVRHLRRTTGDRSQETEDRSQETED